jgi:DNA-binding PadR family transcriptional regulator
MTAFPLRLTAKEHLVMELLMAGGPEQYGLDLVARSDGRLARGTVYVVLDRMEERGLVESWQEDRRPGVSGIPRRMYKPTGLGLRAYRAAEMLANGTLAGPSPAFG